MTYHTSIYERFQITVVIASSAAGDMLPIQSVWGGTTDESLPAHAAPRWKEADDLGFKYAHGDKRHWSSRETAKNVIFFYSLKVFLINRGTVGRRNIRSIPGATEREALSS